jgi:hypothetical protein
MTKIFLNRTLTASERRLNKNKRCIACGAKMPITIVRLKNDDGKLVKKTERWDLECEACRKQRTQKWTNTFDFGAGRASVGHEFRRRMGYNDKDIGIDSNDKKRETK